MRIACPSCTATYEVPEKMLGPGPRTLRCARCGKEWTQPGAAGSPAIVPTPPALPSVVKLPVKAVPPAVLAIPAESEEGPAPGLTAAEEDPDRPLAPPREHAHTFDPEALSYATALTQAEQHLTFRRRPATAAWLGWAASIIVLAVLVWAGYNFRTGVMHAWPPSQRLYTTLGLASAPPSHAAVPDQ